VTECFEVKNLNDFSHKCSGTVHSWGDVHVMHGLKCNMEAQLNASCRVWL